LHHHGSNDHSSFISSFIIMSANNVNVYIVKDDWLSLLLFIAPLACFHLKRNALLSVDSKKKRDDDVAYYLQKAHELRLCLDKPRQSRFRVVALLVLSDGAVIPGTNDEPSASISGALCAERAAFLQLRLVLLEKKVKHQQQRTQQLYVETVYIVTDASIPVPPGMLCREYMYGHDTVRPDRTRFILQSADTTSQPLILTLRDDLYPYPPFYLLLSVEEIAKKGQALSLAVNKALLTSDASQIIANMMIARSSIATRNMLVENNVVPRLLDAARTALELDNRDMVHPLRFGAAAAILRHKRNDSNDGDDDAIIEIVHASQRKAAEYGASLDAVCQLASSFQAHENDSVLVVVQMDQYGILHPPFGIARTFLVEHGHGDCVCLFMRERRVIIAAADDDDDDENTAIQSLDDTHATMSQRLELVAVPAKELAPFPPEFR
jgi:cytidine deaminase